MSFIIIIFIYSIYVVKFIGSNLRHITANLVATLGNIFYFAQIQKSPKFYFILDIPRTYNSTSEKEISDPKRFSRIIRQLQEKLSLTKN